MFVTYISGIIMLRIKIIKYKSKIRISVRARVGKGGLILERVGKKEQK